MAMTPKEAVPLAKEKGARPVDGKFTGAPGI